MNRVPNFLRRQWIARPLAVLSVCFLAGLILRDKFALPLWISAIVGVLGLTLYALLPRKGRYPWYILAMIAFTALGAIRMDIALERNPPIESQYDVPILGHVVSDPEYDEEKQRVICAFQLSSVNGFPADDRVRLYIRSETMPLEGIEYGQELSFVGHVWAQDSATNPYEFDSRKWLLSDGFAGMASAKLEDIAVLSARQDWMQTVIRVKRAISRRIDLCFPHTADVVRAFVLGDRTTLDADTKLDFSRAGITHLICISGMHISTLAAAVSALLRLFTTRRFSFCATLLILFLYGALIGFPASMVRAMVMYAVMSFAPLAGRASDSFTRLCAALLGMLVVRPFYIYDGGFVLSFAASGGIILTESVFEQALGIAAAAKRHRVKHPKLWQRKLRELTLTLPRVLCCTLAAEIATFPAVIAYFGSQSLIGLPVNIFAVPIAMFAYPCALGGLVISAICLPLGSFLCGIPERLFEFLLLLARKSSELPIGALRVPQFPAIVLLAHAAMIVMASGLCRWDIRVRKWMPLGIFLLVGVTLLNAFIQAQGFRVDFLDADQADSALVRADGYVFLVDTGNSYTPAPDYVSAVCIQLDAVFLSHPDSDHAAGLADLLEALPPKIIYVPKGWFELEAGETVSRPIETAKQMGIPVEELSAGDILTPTDECTIRILSPGETFYEEKNRMSLLMDVECRGRRVLFTGDLPSNDVPPDAPDTDVLKVAHHGGKGCCDDDMLMQVKPEIAIVSVGENSYGHPRDDMLSLLREHCDFIYRTDQCGMISVFFQRNGGIRVKTYCAAEAAS